MEDTEGKVKPKESSTSKGQTTAQSTDAQPDVQQGATQLPNVRLPDEVHLQVDKDATKTALVYATQERRYFKMPCKANRPFVQLMNRPMTTLVGCAAAAVGLCKGEHFCCVQLKSDSKGKDIQDCIALCKRSAGIIMVNSVDSISLSDECWKIVSAHSKVMTVVVVPESDGKALLKLLGIDITSDPMTLTRFVYVKIFPRKSEFKMFIGQQLLARISFTMHWRACCLTLDRVKCLHHDYLPSTTPSNEAFLYMYPVKQGDTYESIIRVIPSELKDSQCLKGIVLINYSREVGKTFWATPYTSSEMLLPLYLVDIDHGKLLLQKFLPQQPLPLKLSLVPVQTQVSGVQMDAPEALFIRFMPVSGDLTVSTQHFRWLKLRTKETGLMLMKRIQMMEKEDKYGPVVGFIIGSTDQHSSDFPEDVLSGISESVRDRELPPMIVLKAGDYDRFETYAKSQMFSVKEMKCLSNRGSLLIGTGASLLSSTPCQIEECAGFSVHWLPLLGPRGKAPDQVPYVRMVILDNGEVNKDVLHLVQDELHSERLNYVVMVNNKPKIVFVKTFKRNAAVVKLHDAQHLLQCIGVSIPVGKQNQPASASRGTGSSLWWQEAGNAVLRWFFRGVEMAPKLNRFNWSYNAKVSLCELGPQLLQWNNVQDKDKIVPILYRQLNETGLNHFPLFVLVAIQMQPDARRQLVIHLYTVAQNCDVHQFAKILEDFTNSCSGVKLGASKTSVFAITAEATEKFLELQSSALFKIFWITLSVYFSNPIGSKSPALWRSLSSKTSGCAELPITVKNMREMKMWLTLSQYLKMDNCQLPFEIFLDMLENRRFEDFTIDNAWMLLYELQDDYFMEAAHTQKVLAMLRRKHTSTGTIPESVVKEGIKLLAWTTTVYKDDANIVKEWCQWMKMLASFSCPKGVTERFVELTTLAKKMGDAAIQEEMLAAVIGEMKSSLYKIVGKLSLEDFAAILSTELPFLDFESCVEFFSQFSYKQVRIHSIGQRSFAHACNLALERFPTSEQLHEMIVKVLTRSLTTDVTEPDRLGHLQAHLTLFVPKLLDIPMSDGLENWLIVFEAGWKKFIQDRKMLVTSQKCLNTFLAETNREFTPYHKVILKAFVPCIRIEEHDKRRLPDCPAFHCLGAIISLILQHYDTVDKWKVKSSPPYDSFWEIIKNAALAIPAAERDVTWCQDWRPLVELLVMLQQTFKVMNMGEPVKDLDVQLGDENAKAYFNWVSTAEDCLKAKAASFTNMEWSEDDAFHFETIRKAVVDVSKSLRIDMDAIDTALLQKEANQCRKRAVEVLLRCSYEEWVWLPSIISDYGINPPKALEEFKSIVFKSETVYKQFVVLVGKHRQGAHEAVTTAQEVFRKNVSLRSLKDVVDTLKDSIGCLEDSIAEMVFFHSRESHLFKQHMQITLRNGQLQFEDFVQAVHSTALFLERVNCSQVTYRELKHLQFFDQRKAKKDSEISLLQLFYHKKGVKSSDFLAQLKDMSDLFHALDLIPGVIKVFDTFQMQNCSTHSSYQTLVELERHFSSEEERYGLTGAGASERLEKVFTIIAPLELHHLELFRVVGMSEEFYVFLKGIEQQGAGRFQDLHRLITQFMQHEEYNEAVLNQLPRAREYMLPFLDQKQDFGSLLVGVKAVCNHATASEDFSDLETINHNMNLVKLWFGKAEDDTLESVRKDLDQIMSTGIFLISEVQHLLSDSPGGCLLLRCQPSGDPTSEPWKEDAISDFNRRLGLLERSQEQADDMSEKVDKFQYNYKIARKIVQTWLELKSMRSPKASFDFSLPCSASKEAADKELREMKLFLDEWKQTLKVMRVKHPELCLFKIYKVFQIFKALHSKQIEKLTQEMLLLFTDVHVHETGLKWIKAIQETLLQTKEDLACFPASAIMGLSCAQLCEDPERVIHLNGADTLEENDPIETVGKFLTSAFKLLKCHLPDLLTAKEVTPSGHGVLQPVVHKLKAVHSSQRDLLTLLWSEYNERKLTPFEIYRCHKGTTEEDLSLFFSRIRQFSSVYTLLDVNVLPLRLQEVIVKLHKEIMREESNGRIHYVVTGPSLMQDLPQVTVRTTDHNKAMSEWSQLEKQFHMQTNVLRDFSTMEIVYGRASDGKSQYILKKLDLISSTVTLTIDESFSVVDAIEELRRLPLQTGNGLYLNFTLLPASNSSSEQDRQAYEKLVTKLQCFLFDLFFLGYVEDPQSGLSFSMPKGLKWHVYVEVPTREYRTQAVTLSDAYTLEENRWNDPAKSLQFFLEEYPVLQLIGKFQRVQSNLPLDIDENAQLVCKYLQAYESRNDCRNGIDRSFRGHEGEKVTFRSKADFPQRECQRLLNVYMPKNAKLNKMNNIIFIRYMARRCMFLDMFPAYNYNEVIQYTCKNEVGEQVLVDTSKLGSSLLESMLKEVDDLCSAQRRSTWGGSGDSRQQLVYVTDGLMEEDDGCFELVALNPDDIPEADREKFTRLQVPIIDRDDLETRDCLDKYLSSAFGVMRRVVSEDGQEKMRLKEIDAKNYVLTLDFTMKMLELNERYHAGVPVIIEGETGVGKTFLVEMMADLWNSSLLSKWDRSLGRLWTKLAQLCKEILHSKSSGISDEMKITAWKLAEVARKQIGTEMKNLPALHTLEIEDKLEATLESITLEDVNEILKKSSASLSQQFLSYLRQFLSIEPLLPLLEFSSDKWKRKKSTELSFDNAMKELQEVMHPSLHVCGIVLFHLLKAAKPRVYFKKSIHGALSSKDMRDFMEPIVQRANEVRARWKNPATCPRIIVFLDEINTTFCPGLMKELLVDRSFHGKCLPPNVFIIGACNPHRSNSVVMHEKMEESGECDWVKGSYYVHRLHPTVRCLMWNYGALDEEQEEMYIEAKMKMAIGQYGSSPPLRGGTYLDLLSSHIFESQCLVREFAAKHYVASGMDEGEAKKLARSCVSQRDIQRVFIMYEWLLKAYDLFQNKEVTEHRCYDESRTLQQRAILVALGLVYYFRLNKEFREEYKDRMERICGDDITFTDALDDEMNFYCDTMSLPPGIAKTTALKENLFCIIACCCTKTPLIIVGEPGSSKTLSFNLAAAALRGIESKIDLFRNTDVFPGFDPYYYQCSRKTTSVEVETVFKRAVNRQKAYEVNNRDKFHCVVFMDEAGLPEESMESLKVLHKYLDDAVVSFVGITNHILDAAKSNRAITLFRPRAADDLSQLAMGCFGLTESCDDRSQLVMDEICDSYSNLIDNDKFASFFGLRDFIHFVNYLRREAKGGVQLLSRNEAMMTELVIGGVQRNFNGHQHFEEVCKMFCNVQHGNWKDSLKNLIQLLHESLEDRSFFVDHVDHEEIRYKLVIDPTEDDSSRRFMMAFGLLHPNKAKTLVGSDFPDDGDLHRINTIAEITHAASQGETVLMLQTDDIHESFYDLFNQHFRKIPVKGEGGKRTHFYANVAIGSHSKPCRVHPKFQCIVVIKESDLATTPAPFLNRFEKYRLSPKNMLEAALDHLPRGLQVVVQHAVDEVVELVNKLDKSSFCGMRREEDTIMSVFLDMVPKTGYNNVHLNISEPITVDEETGLPSVFFLKFLLQALNDAGFNIYEYNAEEEWDIVCNLIKGDISGLPHLDSAATTDAWTELTNLDTRSDSQNKLVRFLQDVLCHWMYASAAKKILQILTPEALILWRRSKAIPPWYVDTYLKQQHHFNLKELITFTRDATQQRSGKGFMKVVCFTRSSQAVSQLTATGHTRADEERVIKKLVVTSEPQRVKLCRMSTVSSQQEFSEQMAEFQGSNEKDTMLIVANMQEATKKLINYVRLRIDEEEEKWMLKRQEGISASEDVDEESHSGSEEVEQEVTFAASEGEEDETESYVVWEYDGEEVQSSPSHHNETQNREPQTADIQSAASATCSPSCSSASLVQTVDKQTKAYVLLLHFPPSVSQRACYPALFLYGWDYHYLDSLVASAECAIPLNEWCHVAFQQTAEGIQQERVAINWSMLLEHTALVMASRIALYNRNDSTPVAISADKKSTMFKKLLQGPLGQKLHDLYSSYWSPRNVAKFLQGAAVYARCRMSMISVTDVVQNFFESTLHNFLAYMLYHISEELGLDTYVDESKELFLALLDIVPRPKSLSDLKTYNNTWGVSSDVWTQLQATDFPGFSKICASIEVCFRKIFDEIMVKEESAQSLTALNLKELSEQLQDYAHTHGQDRLQIALPYLKEDDSLWERYETDFIKFRFAVTDVDLKKAILAAVAERNSTMEDSNLERLVALHFLAYSRHFDVAALDSVITPLRRLKKTLKRDLSSFSSVVEGVLVKGRDASQSEMAHFVIENLFESLVNCSEDSERLQDWQKACRSILFTPKMERILYSREYGMDYRGKFNMVQAAFLLLQSAQDDATVHMLRTCCSELQMSEQSLAMKEIFTYLVDVQNSSSNNQDYVSHLCQHFFHSFRPCFYEDDILYFFQFVAALQFDSLVTDKQCVTLGVLKHCMLTVLDVTDDENDTRNYYGLSSKAVHLLGLHLERWTKCSAENYHPPCFEIVATKDSPSALAHIYFLTFLDHIRLKYKFEKQHRSHWKIHDMLHSKKLPTAEMPIMHAIEKQAWLHAFIKQLSVALLDDSQAKQIDDAISNKGLLTVLCNDQFHLWHKQLLMDMVLRLHPSEKKVKRLVEKVNIGFAGVAGKTDNERKKEHLQCHLQTPWTYEEMKSFVTEQSQAKWRRDNPHILLMHRLVESYEKLNAGLGFVPTLLQFCSKLKKHLDFKCHEQEATTMTLKTAVDKACSEMNSREEKRHLRRSLQNEFIAKFNYYQSTLGKARKQEIAGDTPLTDIFCLNGEKKSAMNQVLDNICATCNSFIAIVHKCAKRNISLLNWVTLDQPRTPASLLQYHDAWQLLSRPLNKESLMSCFRRCIPVFEEEVNFEQLSAEVIKTFFFGLSVSTMEVDQLSADKVFRLCCQSAVKRGHSSATEYSDVCMQLRAFPGELDVSCRKDVFAHFHGISHRALQSVVDSLLMIAHHLTQAEDASVWANSTLSQYIQDIDESRTVNLTEFVNLPRDMSGAFDLHFLETLRVGNLLGALNLLVSWLETGFCNFHTLPLGVKKELPPEMVQCVEQKAAELQEKPKQKANLIRLEEAIPPEVMGFGMGEFDTSAFELPLKVYLKKHRICRSETLLQCIPEKVQLEHYVHFLILIRSLTEKDRLPTSSEDTDTSDSEEEEVVESENEEEEVLEEETQQEEKEEEEALFGFGTEEAWEQHYDDNFGKVKVPSSSNPEAGEVSEEGESSRNWDAAAQQKMYDVGNAKETVAVDQMLEDSTSSFAVEKQLTEDSLTIGEYDSDDAFQSASDNDSESDDSTDEHFRMYNTLFAPQSYSMDARAQAMLPLQSSIPSALQGDIGSYDLESPVGSERDSTDEFLSASEGDEESFVMYEQSQAMRQSLPIVSVRETAQVSAGMEVRVKQESTQKQPATDLPRHQFQDTEETLEQVINLPEQTQVTNVSQEEVHSSVHVEETPSGIQLPGPSPDAGIMTPSDTMQVNQPELLGASLPVTVSDVCEWLKKIGMSQYVAKFAEEQVDGQLLVNLEKEELPLLGVENLLHQKRLLMKINNLKK